MAGGVVTLAGRVAVRGVAGADGQAACLHFVLRPAAALRGAPQDAAAHAPELAEREPPPAAGPGDADGRDHHLHGPGPASLQPASDPRHRLPRHRQPAHVGRGLCGQHLAARARGAAGV
eukprot:3266300-Rhodomonas_salina.1